MTEDITGSRSPYPYLSSGNLYDYNYENEHLPFAGKRMYLIISYILNIIIKISHGKYSEKSNSTCSIVICLRS